VPECVADNRDIGPSGLLFFRKKSASPCRPNTQHVKKILRDVGADYHLRFVLGRECKPQNVVRRRAFQGAVMLLDLCKLGVGNRDADDFVLLVHLRNGKQSP